jgi:hypothetical protein
MAHLSDGHVRVRLAQGKHDLGPDKLGLFHDIVLGFTIQQCLVFQLYAGLV